LDLLVSRGIVANRHKEFQVILSGPDVYSLLQFLENFALDSGSYVEVARAVDLCEHVRRQAKEQGF
jgi:hypothetical protein